MGLQANGSGGVFTNASQINKTRIFPRRMQLSVWPSLARSSRTPLQIFLWFAKHTIWPLMPHANLSHSENGRVDFINKKAIAAAGVVEILFDLDGALLDSKSGL